MGSKRHKRRCPRSVRSKWYGEKEGDWSDYVLEWDELIANNNYYYTLMYIYYALNTMKI